MVNSLPLKSKDQSLVEQVIVWDHGFYVSRLEPISLVWRIRHRKGCVEKKQDNLLSFAKYL